MGTVAVDENRRAQVRARFAGLVREVRAGLGDTVGVGQTLAIVESNESLKSYAVTAPIAGRVVRSLYVPGAFLNAELDKASEENERRTIVIESATLAERDVPDYIDADHGKSSATFTRTPTLSDVPYAVQMEPNLVIEFYSR